jgi:GDPmannose 4,6-dehydratase
MTQKTALITGITGQDGAYLARLLVDKGYRVVGAARRSAAINKWRLAELGLTSEVELVSIELTEDSSVRAVLEEVRPDEIYNLAAQSFVADSFRQPLYTANVDGLGVMRLLEGMRSTVPEARFYQASTSEMFGKVRETPQTEDTTFHPRSPYGVAKVFGHWATVNYREAHGLFATSGILFNHESPLRGPEFLTRKVTLGIANYAVNGTRPLLLGNLDAARDWGFAGDYVRGMWNMLQQSRPDDFILATGRAHTVREFVDFAASTANIELSWEGQGLDAKGIDRKTGKPIVIVDPKYHRPAEVDMLIGDASKAKAALGWVPEVTFEQMIKAMVDADIARVAGGSIAAIS